MSDDVLSLPAGRQLDVKVAEALGEDVTAYRAVPKAYRPKAYSTSGDQAVALAQRFAIRIFPVANWCRVSVYNQRGPLDAEGETIPHAVARWVARYVKNGEVSE